MPRLCIQQDSRLPWNTTDLQRLQEDRKLCTRLRVAEIIRKESQTCRNNADTARTGFETPAARGRVRAALPSCMIDASLLILEARRALGAATRARLTGARLGAGRAHLERCELFCLAFRSADSNAASGCPERHRPPARNRGRWHFNHWTRGNCVCCFSGGITTV